MAGGIRQLVALLVVLLVALLGASLGLTACAEAAGEQEPPGPAVDLLGEWELVEGSTGGVPVPIPSGSPATIAFADGEVRGSSFCNGYGGGYALTGSSLRIEDLSGTEMACGGDGVMGAESIYRRALEALDTAAVEGDTLSLTGGDVALRFRRVAEVPPLEMVGTRWVLETLLREDMASSTVGQPAVLVLAGDGGLSGSTGCRVLHGRWARAGGSLAFPETRTEGDCPPDVRVQDEHVRAVLEGETSATVDGDRLSIVNRDGFALVYRADR